MSTPTDDSPVPSATTRERTADESRPVTRNARAAELDTLPEGVIGALQTDQGVTTIADGVVQKIASIATRETAGVHALGGGAARALGGLRERIPGSAGPSLAQGVSVEVGEKQAAVDLSIVVDYGFPIAQVAGNVRRNVINRIERMTGLQVTEVNVDVNDINLDTDDVTVGTPRTNRVE